MCIEASPPPIFCFALHNHHSVARTSQHNYISVRKFSWVTAKRTGTQGQKGHTRPCLNCYPDPKLKPNPIPLP